MTDSELVQAMGNPVTCLWAGLPPCPKCGGNHGDPNCDEDKDQLLRSRHSANELTSYVITCRLVNQREWMEGLAKRLNQYADVIEANCRFEFNGDSLERIAVPR